MITLTITLYVGGSKITWNFGKICSKKDMVKHKGRFHPRKGHKGPEGELRYRLLFL
jgi:hypothetical protein